MQGSEGSALDAGERAQRCRGEPGRPRQVVSVLAPCLLCRPQRDPTRGRSGRRCHRARGSLTLLKSAVKEMRVPSGLRSSRLMLSASLSACRLSSATWPSGSRTRTRSSAGAPGPGEAPSSGTSSGRSSSAAGAGGTPRRPSGRIPGGGRAQRGRGPALPNFARSWRLVRGARERPLGGRGRTWAALSRAPRRLRGGRGAPGTPAHRSSAAAPAAPDSGAPRLGFALFIQSHPPSLPSENRNHQDLP